MIKATVLAHSMGHNKTELITFLSTMPRIILAEVNTHRAFSRNSASSRAIPFLRMIASIQENPFIPIAWQKEHKGMQGTQYITDKVSIQRRVDQWLYARDLAILSATKLYTPLDEYGDQDADATWEDEESITKQLCNRILEPFMYHTCIITTGLQGLNNFFDLRCPQYKYADNIYKSRHECISNYPINNNRIELEWLQLNKGQAEIHMMKLAELMYDAYSSSFPQLLKAGEWHIPYKTEIQELFRLSPDWNLNSIPYEAYISSVMCARTSYTIPDHDLSEWTLEKYMEKAMQLVEAKPLHASPFEHCAERMSQRTYELEFTGNSHVEDGWCRNYQGFTQLRHKLENAR